MTSFLLILTIGAAQSPDARYQTRTSDCVVQVPTGTPLAVRRTDSGVMSSGYRAERVLTFVGGAPQVTGGEITVCTEYGRVEIADSEDDQVRLQVRAEAFGEGAPDPAHAAMKAIHQTDVRAHLTSDAGRLRVSVWHATLGFTPARQPTLVGIRLLVPRGGAYRIATQAFHGQVAVRRLTLAGGALLGAVGDKFKGIAGFLFGTELDNVALAGDVDIDNVTRSIPSLLALAAPIYAKVRVTASCRLRARTGGDINIAVQPAPDLGVHALGESNDGVVRIAVDGGVARDAPPTEAHRIRAEFTSAAFDAKRIRLDVYAASSPGKVNIASIPAAPLAGAGSP